MGKQPNTDEKLSEPDSTIKVPANGKDWEGWLDRISNWKIQGWACKKNSTQPVEVILYLNNKEIMRTIADKFRQDILEQGIHPEGKCAFEFDIDGRMDLTRKDLVQVRIEGQSEVLPTMGYTDWTQQFYQLSDTDRRAIFAHIDSFQYKPLISIIMPVYNTPIDILRKAVDSVKKQLYGIWELCIADDASTDPAIRKELEEYKKNDPRIKVTYRETNGHISEASNSALQLVQGEYVALMDHDDELTEDALYRVVNELNANWDLDIIYSDEDKIDMEGERHDPNFKPDWNPDYFLGTNYVCHLTVIRASLLEKVKGFRKGFEGAQDYDLLLRCYRETSPEKIQHIPCVLYHWRMMENSTATSIGAKPYAIENGRRALEEYLQSIGQQGKVSLVAECTMYRIQYPLPKTKPLVSIIIPTKDKRALLEKCITSIIEKTDYPNYEILIVNNQSSSKTCLQYLESLKKNKTARIIEYDHPFNFSALNNYAAGKAKGELLCFLNNDTEVISPDWLTEMASHAARPEIGAVGAKLLYGNGTIQHAGVVTGMGGIAGHPFKFAPGTSPGIAGRLWLTQNFTCVTAACLVIRREVFEKVKGFVEELKVTFNDVDFCLRVQKAGYRNLWTPHAVLYHHESKSRGKDDTNPKKARFKSEVEYLRKHWGEELLKDPYYNPNYSLENDQWDLEYPPRTQSPWKNFNESQSKNQKQQEQENLEPWVNKGFAPLDVQKVNGLKGKRKTVIVVGVARGGTSFLSGVLHKLGVFMGDQACAPVYEDVRLAQAFEAGNLDNAKTIIEEYNGRYNIWGFKRPVSVGYLNRLVKIVENPVFLFIFRDIFSIANRNKISMDLDFISGLERALDHYSKIISFIKTQQPCGFSMSYEKAFEHKEKVVDGLIEFLEIPATPLQRKEALDFITRNPTDYLKTTRINNNAGYVDQVTKSKILGWARNKESLTSSAVILYINDQKISRMQADKFRMDLLRKGIHPEGKCAFEFNIEGVVDLKATDVIQVRAEGDSGYLPHSHGAIKL